jgi:hypothetical protein
MSTILRALVTAFLLFTVPCVSLAAPLKTYVAEFSVVGAPNRDELKVMLQGLLTSRLNPDQVQLVETPDKAELLLSGSYALFGKMFSVDVLLKNTLNGDMSKVFEQGESQDDLIPAFGRLAQKLDRKLAGAQPVAAHPQASAPAPVVQLAASTQKIIAPSTAYKVAAPLAKAEEGYVVKSGIPASDTPGNWTSDPLPGVFTSVALGRSLPSGEREIFVAGAQSIRYLRKGTQLKQVVELVIPVPAKILAIDTADLDHDGTPELYVTIVDRKTVSSRVYQPTDSGLELIADNQPWLYRGIGPDFKDRTIFVQGVSSTGEFQSGVAELVKSGRLFDAQNKRTLPRSGNIFNFTRFRDKAGVEKLVVVDEDGYLVIYGADGSELWKSSDKYGGSETYFNYESVAQLRAKGNVYRWNFLEQRITALPDGTLIMPRNEGSFGIGNNRAYNKHSLLGLEWTGSIFREAWHTRQTPSYLADYAYEASTREVILLEVVQRAGLFGAGKTAISINKLD